MGNPGKADRMWGMSTAAAGESGRDGSQWQISAGGLLADHGGRRMTETRRKHVGCWSGKALAENFTFRCH